MPQPSGSSNGNHDALYSEASGQPDYGDKRARNKRTGPGCDSRRLHQSSSGLSPELCGADQHRQTCKGVAFSRHGPPFRAFKLTANDNFAEDIRLAA